ncbi:MAG: hypothetical protein RJA70_2947 [Pseudomonadota bacterium]|jgi:hypothetical protein
MTVQQGVVVVARLFVVFTCLVGCGASSTSDTGNVRGIHDGKDIASDAGMTLDAGITPDAGSGGDKDAAEREPCAQDERVAGGACERCPPRHVQR